MALFDGFWLCWDIAKTQLKIWILCLMFAISVPSVCTYGVRLHVDLTLLSMEMIFHIQILKKFRVWRAVARIEVEWFFSLKRKKFNKFHFSFITSMSYRNELRSANNYQNVIKPKYVVNGYFAHLWFTSDDFLKNFRWPDENIMKFRDIFIRPSILLRKVIRSDPVML